MGQANAKVHNDTDQIREVLSFNYSDGIRLIPQTKLVLAPGETGQFVAMADDRGLVIATATYNKGNHYYAKNGEVVKLSDVLKAEGNDWAKPLTIVASTVGGAALLGPVGGVIGLVGSGVGTAGVKNTGGTKWVEQDQKVANAMDGKSSTRAQQRQPRSNVQNSHAPPMQPEGTKWVEPDGNLASSMDGKSSTKAQQRQPGSNLQKSHAPPMQPQHDSSSDEIDDDIEIINKSSIY